MGNRLSRQDSAAGATNYSYNAANMLLSTGGVGASGFQNDADGNTLSGNGRTNTWNSQNRLVSCIINGNTTAYRYGADGLRRQSTKNGVSTDYAYDGTMLVREGHASGGSLTPSTVTATYFIGASGPCYRRDDTATETDSQGRTVTKARWYIYDGLGSVVGEVDPLGNLTSSPKYDVYGAVRANSGTATSKQGFVGSLGHVSDDTGLIYMRARYMDPSTGRFISEDPAESGSNWFIYVTDNPVNDVDENGLFTLQESITTEAIAGGMDAAGGDGALAGEKFASEKLGEAVAAHNLEIMDWLLPEGENGTLSFRATGRGIEITANGEDAMITRKVFVDIVNKFEETAGHARGIHLDFQQMNDSGKFKTASDAIELGLDSFKGWVY